MYYFSYKPKDAENFMVSLDLFGVVKVDDVAEVSSDLFSSTTKVPSLSSVLTSPSTKYTS